MVRMVLMNGLQWWVVQHYEMSDYLENPSKTSPTWLHELQLVESASVDGKTRTTIVEDGRAFLLPSSINFWQSDWWLGMNNENPK